MKKKNAIIIENLIELRSFLDVVYKMSGEPENILRFMNTITAVLKLLNRGAK